METFVKNAGGEWVPGELVVGEPSRIVDSAGNIQEQDKYTPEESNIVETVIEIDAKVNGAYEVDAKLNDVIAVTASFSDKSLNIAKLKVSVVDRLGGLIQNIDMAVVNGEGTGSITVDKPIDYLVTNKGINFHRKQLDAELVLVKELAIRIA